MIRCDLCGHTYEPNELVCHASCPLAEKCAVICCPNCGYQVVDTSRSGVLTLAQKVRSLLQKQPTTEAAP